MPAGCIDSPDKCAESFKSAELFAGITEIISHEPGFVRLASLAYRECCTSSYNSIREAQLLLTEAMRTWGACACDNHVKVRTESLCSSECRVSKEKAMHHEGLSGSSAALVQAAQPLYVAELCLQVSKGRLIQLSENGPHNFLESGEGRLKANIDRCNLKAGGKVRKRSHGQCIDSQNAILEKACREGLRISCWRQCEPLRGGS